MTRVNCGVDPCELPDKLLLAEHREIVRIPNNLASGKARYVFRDIPEKFCLGAGHVKFFYNKLTYLQKRYFRLFDECRKRGFNVTYFGDAFDRCYLADWWNDYEPTDDDRALIVQRISEKGFKLKHGKAFVK